jgi:hypothetical protein
MEMVPETLIFNNNSRNNNSRNNNSRNNNSRNNNSRSNTSNSHGIIQTRTRCRTDQALMVIRPLATQDIRQQPTPITITPATKYG